MSARIDYVTALLQQIRICEDDQQIRVFRIKDFIAIKTTVTSGMVWYLSPLKPAKRQVHLVPTSTNHNISNVT